MPGHIGEAQTVASFSVAGALTVNGSTTLAPTAGTITMSGIGWSIVNSGTLTFNGLTIAGTPSSQSGASYSVAGGLDSQRFYSTCPIQWHGHDEQRRVLDQ